MAPGQLHPWVICASFSTASGMMAATRIESALLMPSVVRQL